jgi:plastocyanin
MAKTHTIEITEMKFPEKTDIAAGDTVEWINKMSMIHTVTADNGEFDSGDLRKDQSFWQVFASAGEVPYHCEKHPALMQGTVVVS